MKKTLSMVLALALLMAALPALASGFRNEESGITITIPDGLEAQDISEGEITSLLIVDPADETIVYIYEVYDSGARDQWLEDQTEEKIGEMAEALASNMGDLSYALAEEDGIYYLVVEAEDGSFGGFVSLLNGWICALYAVVADGYEMVDGAWDDLYTLQMGISYEG